MIRLSVLLICYMLLGANIVFCQPGKGFDMSKIYDTAIQKYLLPSINNSESIIYLEKPSFHPEYSIRLIVFRDCNKLEGYFFKESYFSQLLRHIQDFRNVQFEPEVSHYSVLVSKSFKKRFQSIFYQAIKSKGSSTMDMVIQDGTSYMFRIISRKNSSLEIHEPEKSSKAFKVAIICQEIANDLKSKNFSESKIIGAIDEL